MQKSKAIFKALEPRLHPTMQDGHCIKYFLKLKGFSLSAVGCRVCVKGETVLNVVCGRRRSHRVEAEIARVLGKASWNEVVAEARLAVSGNYAPSSKDVEQFLERTYQQYQNRLAEIAEHKKQMAEKLKPMRAAIAVKKWKR